MSLPSDVAHIFLLIPLLTTRVYAAGNHCTVSLGGCFWFFFKHIQRPHLKLKWNQYNDDDLNFRKKILIFFQALKLGKIWFENRFQGGEESTALFEIYFVNCYRGNLVKIRRADSPPSGLIFHLQMILFSFRVAKFHVITMSRMP